jgi:hypothetical protein
MNPYLVTEVWFRDAATIGFSTDTLMNIVILTENRAGDPDGDLEVSIPELERWTMNFYIPDQPNKCLDCGLYKQFGKD